MTLPSLLDIFNAVTGLFLVWVAIFGAWFVGYLMGHSFGWTDGYAKAVDDERMARAIVRAIGTEPDFPSPELQEN